MDEEPLGEPSPSVPPPNSRQRRARRRHRRRVIGTLLFIAAAGGIIAVAYVAVAGDDDSSNRATTNSTTTTDASAATTTTAPKFAGSYKVTTDVNVRQGPGTNFPSVGTVEPGRSVIVVCVVDGQPVDGPNGPNAQWLQATGLGPSGYISSIYVSTGADLSTGKIPTCPAA